MNHINGLLCRGEECGGNANENGGAGEGGGELKWRRGMGGEVWDQSIYLIGSLSTLSVLLYSSK